MNLSITSIYRLQIPFKGGAYKHNLAKRSATDSVVLVIEDSSGVQGFGECCPRDYVTGETFDSVVKNTNTLASALYSSFDGTIDSAIEILNLVPDRFPSVRCLIETALFTYLIRKTERNPFELLGIAPARNSYYSAAFDSGEQATFQKMIQFYAAMQFKNAKLKVHSDNEVNKQRIGEIRQYLGEKTSIRMDGNEIWEWNKNKSDILALVETGISCFEQLFSKDDLESCFAFRNYFGEEIELIADESVTTLNSAQFHAENNFYTGVNLKISKNGGLLRCLEIAKLFEHKNKTVRLGCHVGETSLLSLWGLLFSTSYSNIKDMEGAFGTYLLTEDPFQPSILFGKGGELEVTGSFVDTLVNFQFRQIN